MSDEENNSNNSQSGCQLKVNASHPRATLVFDHWLRILEGSIAQISDPTDAKKLHMLIKNLSAENYALVKECTSYASAVKALKDTFIRKPNLLVARHKLASRRQEPEENIRDYVDSLLQLATECEFKAALTAEQYREERVRDTFIWGLRDPVVRSHLLEKGSLSLNTAVEAAKVFTDARKEATITTSAMAIPSYIDSSPNEPSNKNTPKAHENFEASAAPRQNSVSAVPMTRNFRATSHSNYKASGRNVKCRNCDNFLPHYYGKCPAADKMCRYCHKIGHFAKICGSKRRGEPPVARQSSSMATSEGFTPHQASAVAIPPLSSVTPYSTSESIASWETIPLPTNEPGKNVLKFLIVK